MTEAPDDLPKLRSEVSRLMGQSILNLQIYESGLKSLIAHHRISATGADARHQRDKRHEKVKRMTLGQLVGALTDSYLEPMDAEAEEDREDDAPGLTIRFSVGLPEEKLEQMRNDLRELVVLRNDLVHHFVVQHDTTSAEGCSRAIAVLKEAAERIKIAMGQLRDMVMDMPQVWEAALVMMRPGGALSDAIDYGVLPDRVEWRIAPIVTALTEAAAAVGVGGWAEVEKAGAWVSKHHPDLSPRLYRCESWQQVLQDSGRFDLRDRDRDGSRNAVFRARKRRTRLH